MATPPKTTKGTYGTITDFGYGQAYTDPRDNPNYNAPKTVTPPVQQTPVTAPTVERTYDSYRDDPRVTVGGVRQGQDTSNVSVRSEESIYSDMYSRARGELDALGQLEKDLLAEQNVINEKNDRSTQAISTLSGLGGSTEADISQQKTTAIGQKANKQIQNEINLQRQQLLSKIRGAATEEARALRLEARQSEQDRIANRAARQQEAQTFLQNISASGLNLDELKASDTESYNYLAKQYGSEDALKGAYTLNTPQEQILDKRLEGGKYIIAKQNPTTGKISVETVDLGLPVGYSKTIDAGDRILAVPDNWDGNPAKLVSVNKGLTPGGGSKEKLTPYQQFMATQAIAKDTQARTEQAREMARQSQLIQQSYNNIESGGDRSLNTQAIVTSFNKILDPSSVVRESEYDRTAAGQSLLARLEGKVQNIAAGGAGVTPATLKEASDIANEYLKGAKKSIETQNARAREMANQFGLNPDFVTSTGQIDSGDTSTNGGTNVVTAPDGSLVEIID